MGHSKHSFSCQNFSSMWSNSSHCSLYKNPPFNLSTCSVKDEFIRSSHYFDAVSLSLSFSLPSLPLKSNHTAHHSHTLRTFPTCSSSWDLAELPLGRWHISSPGSLHEADWCVNVPTVDGRNIRMTKKLPQLPSLSASSPSAKYPVAAPLRPIPESQLPLIPSLLLLDEIVMKLSVEQAESYQIQCFSWIRASGSLEVGSPALDPELCPSFPWHLCDLDVSSGNCPSLLLCSPSTRWVLFKLFYF